MKKYMAYMNGEAFNGGILYMANDEQRQLFDISGEDAYGGDYAYGDTEVEAAEDVADFVAESFLNSITSQYEIIGNYRLSDFTAVIKIFTCDNGECDSISVTFKNNGRIVGKVSISLEEQENEEE